MTPQQAALLQKAQESMRAARLLVKENLYDFSISRSYYALFYLAQGYLLERGLSFSSHAAVISAFGQQFARTGVVPVEFHRTLIDAQDLRTRADYVIDSHLTEADALELMVLLQKLSQLLDIVLYYPYLYTTYSVSPIFCNRTETGPDTFRVRPLAKLTISLENAPATLVR